MGKLTIRTIERLLKAQIPGMTNDGNGLYLRITQSGTACWIFRYKRLGKAHDMGLGSYPVVTLAQARVHAMDARRMLHAGIDPLELRAQEREQIAKAHAEREAAKIKPVSFDDMAADYIATHATGWRSAKTLENWRNSLRLYVSPVLGRLDVAKITTQHVLEVLMPIWAEKTETASRVRNRIELVLNAAKAKGLRTDDNPARWKGHLDKLLPPRAKVSPVRHYSAMPYADVPAFMRLLAARNEVTYLAMQFTILTACRTGEVLGAQWDEFDLSNRVWTIPAQRTKAGKEHRVPITEPLLALLKRLPHVAGNPYLFPGQKAKRPISNMAMLNGLEELGFDHFTMHGFRSSFRDWCAECTHYPREVFELSLSHSVASGVEAAYWRSDIFDKRRALMADWADYVTARPSEKVTQLKSVNA